CPSRPSHPPREGTQLEEKVAIVPEISDSESGRRDDEREKPDRSASEGDRRHPRMDEAVEERPQTHNHPPESTVTVSLPPPTPEPSDRSFDGGSLGGNPSPANRPVVVLSPLMRRFWPTPLTRLRSVAKPIAPWPSYRSHERLCNGYHRHRVYPRELPSVCGRARHGSSGGGVGARSCRDQRGGRRYGPRTRGHLRRARALRPRGRSSTVQIPRRRGGTSPATHRSGSVVRDERVPSTHSIRRVSTVNISDTESGTHTLPRFHPS